MLPLNKWSVVTDEIFMKVQCSNCLSWHYKRPRDMKATKSGRVFCSNKCNSEYKGQNVKYHCQLCGVVLPKKQKFCSRICSNKARTGTKYGRGQPNNRQKLIERLKEQLRIDRGNKCERCGYDESPQILVFHHKIERSNGGADTVENGELLCPNCHAKHHYMSG